MSTKALSHVALRAIPHVAQRALLNVAQRALLHVAQRAILNVAQRAILNVAQLAILNVAQRAILHIAQPALLHAAPRDVPRVAMRPIAHVAPRITLRTIPHTALRDVPIALVVASACAAAAGQTLAEPDVAAAWRTLRAMDCARCHGKAYHGSSGPSIVEYARTQSREMFVRAVLDGNPGRGMPGYRGNPLIEPAIDGIYRYFKGRADGIIAAEDRPA